MELSTTKKLTLNKKNVLLAFDSLVIKKTQYTDEKNCERLVKEHLDKNFAKVHRQYNQGGYIGAKSDIDLGDGKFGIEIKLLKQMTDSSSIYRMFGQLVYYMEFYSGDDYEGKNIFLLLIGTEKEFATQRVKDIIKKVKIVLEINVVSVIIQ